MTPRNTEKQRLLKLAATLHQLRDAYLELAQQLRELQFTRDCPERQQVQQQAQALLARIGQRIMPEQDGRDYEL